SIGDYLLDAWFDGDPDDLFDAPEAVPIADIGRIDTGAWVDGGWFNHSGAAISLADIVLEAFGGAVTIKSITDFPASLSAAPAWNAATPSVSVVIPQRRMTTAD